MIRRHRTLLAALASAACLSACGVASVSPLVTDEDLVDEPRLAGHWENQKDRESVVVTRTGPSVYRLLYTDSDRKTGVFDARAGRLGPLRVLDVHPVEPIPGASDVYKSLLLRAHGLVIVDSIGVALQVRLIRSDSLREYLKRMPQAVAHTMSGEHVLFTGPSLDVRRFLEQFMKRPGVIDTPGVWRRSDP